MYIGELSILLRVLSGDYMALMLPMFFKILMRYSMPAVLLLAGIDLDKF